MKKEEIKKPVQTQKIIKKETVEKIAEKIIEVSQEAEIPYGKMSSYPEHNLDKNWSREDTDGQEINESETITNKLDKILVFLNSIESELIEYNNPKNLVESTIETKDEFSLYEISWNTLEYLHKQAADTLNRLNFHPQNQSEEFNFAKKRFNKLNEVLLTRINSINWD